MFGIGRRIMGEEKRDRLENQLYVTGICLLLGGIGVCMLQRIMPLTVTGFFQMPCVFYKVTGLYCPGCGGTRAVAALLQRKVILSFLYHPVLIYGVLIYGWFMISHTIEKLSGSRFEIGMRYRNLYLYLGLGIVILNIAVKDIALTAFHIDILKLLDHTHALI